MGSKSSDLQIQSIITFKPLDRISKSNDYFDFLRQVCLYQITLQRSIFENSK